MAYVSPFTEKKSAAPVNSGNKVKSTGYVSPFAKVPKNVPETFARNIDVGDTGLGVTKTIGNPQYNPPVDSLPTKYESGSLRAPRSTDLTFEQSVERGLLPQADRLNETLEAMNRQNDLVINQYREEQYAKLTPIDRKIKKTLDTVSRGTERTVQLAGTGLVEGLLGTDLGAGKEYGTGEKNLSGEELNIAEKFVKAGGNLAGMLLGFKAVGGLLPEITTLKGVSSATQILPRAARKVLVPLVSSMAKFGVDNTLLGQVHSFVKNESAVEHLQKILPDFAIGSVLALIPKATEKIPIGLQIPVVGSIWGGFSKLQGASNEDAVIQGILMGGLHGFGLNPFSKSTPEKAFQISEKELGVKRTDAPGKIQGAFAEKSKGMDPNSPEYNRLEFSTTTLLHPEKVTQLEVAFDESRAKIKGPDGMVIERAPVQEIQFTSPSEAPVVEAQRRVVNEPNISKEQKLIQSEVAAPIVDVPALENQIKDVYKGQGQHPTHPDFTKADGVLADVFAEMQISEAGYRIKDSATGEFSGVKSTFPDWVPENLRSKELFDKVLGGLDLNNLKFPEGNRPKQRALYDAILGEVDARLGVDTRPIRDQIINSYESTRTSAPGAVTENQAGVNRSPTGGSGRTEGVEPTPEAKKLQSRVFERLKEETPTLEGDLSYEAIKLKEDAQRAVELVANDKQKAYRIAMGAEKSSDVTSTAVNIAMAEKALADGNNGLYARLVKTRSLEQTRRGQEIVAEKGSVTDNSTSRYVKELISERLKNVGKKYLTGLKDIFKKTTDKSRATEVIDREVKKAQAKIKGKELDISEAQKLIDSLICK
mgnify:CR=1 FL=1